MSELNYQPGSIDAADRVMRELLRTPRFKNGVKVLLNSLDPKSAPGLVRTLMWEDAELFLDVVGVAPDVLNALLLGSREAIVQAENYPKPVLADFISQMLDKFDAEELGSTIGKAAALLQDVQNVPGDPVQKSFEDFKSRVNKGLTAEGQEDTAFLMLSVLQPLLRQQMRRLALEAAREGSETQKVIQGLSQAFMEEVKENPDFLNYVLRPFFDSLPGTDSENG